MTDSTLTSADVKKATAEDLAFILDWLEREYHEDGGSGFWPNRGIISRALDETEDLWVIRRDGRAVAFQVGDYAADIVSVRKDHRHEGLGTALFEASLERAVRDDVNVLSGQCSPETSLGFWQRMGFERYHDRNRPRDLMVRRILPRRFDLPADAQRAVVSIGFYPEEAQYYGRKGSVPAVHEHRVTGARLGNGSVMLDRRVLGLSADEPKGRDLVVRVEVDGEERCFCKAKYEEAQDAGVKQDWRGGAFYVDAIEPKKGDL